MVRPDATSIRPSRKANQSAKPVNGSDAIRRTAVVRGDPEPTPRGVPRVVATLAGVRWIPAEVVGVPAGADVVAVPALPVAAVAGDDEVERNVPVPVPAGGAVPVDPAPPDPPPTWTVPIELSADCDPPVGVRPTDATTFGSVTTPKGAPALTGLVSEPSAVTPGCAAWTVPADPVAVWEPPPPTCTVPSELSADCVPPVAGSRAADVISVGSAVRPPAPTDVGLASEPSAVAPGYVAWTVPTESVADWEPPPPTCAVPMERFVDCVPPELGEVAAETAAVGLDETPAALAVVGADADAFAAVAGGRACTVPTELLAVCGPEPTCAVPTELFAVCDPPVDGSVAAVTAAVGELETPAGSTDVGAETPTPASTAGGCTWTVPIEPVAIWSA